MRYKQFAILLFVVLFFGGCFSAHTTIVTRSALHPRLERFRANEKAIVQVLHFHNSITFDAQGKPIRNSDGKLKIQQMASIGTGSAVRSYGIVLTEAHVVEASKEDKKIAETYKFDLGDQHMVCTVKAGIRDCHKAEIIHKDSNQDFALLRTDIFFYQVVKFVDDLKFFGDKNIEPEDYEVYFWGNISYYLPSSPLFGHYLGRVSRPYVQEKFFGYMTPLLLMDITVIPACSGAPVFNRFGLAVGMAEALTPRIKLGRVLGIMIPSSRVIPYLKANVPSK